MLDPQNKWNAWVEGGLHVFLHTLTKNGSGAFMLNSIELGERKNKKAYFSSLAASTVFCIFM